MIRKYTSSSLNHPASPGVQRSSLGQRELVGPPLGGTRRGKIGAGEGEKGREREGEVWREREREREGGRGKGREGEGWRRRNGAREEVGRGTGIRAGDGGMGRERREGKGGRGREREGEGGRGREREGEGRIGRERVPPPLSSPVYVPPAPGQTESYERNTPGLNSSTFTTASSSPSLPLV